ncbi:hypothetical protein AVEN_142259-1 [Araneus ventricosus]|uniref:Uncharacterized protein n=1 Tax=Araneus ventricosus TaxID=182803 RepID=A0A4Y2FHY6_ARAVE|nr:hypothetical protein AVEN_142259-1 [Araneus ventricosus]
MKAEQLLAVTRKLLSPAAATAGKRYAYWCKDAHPRIPIVLFGFYRLLGDGGIVHHRSSFVLAGNGGIKNLNGSRAFSHCSTTNYEELV